MRSIDELKRIIAHMPQDIAEEIIHNSDPIVDMIRENMDSDRNTPEHPEGYDHAPSQHPQAPHDDGKRGYSGETQRDVQVIQCDDTHIFIGNANRADIAQGQDLGWGSMGSGERPSGSDQPDMQGAHFYENAIPTTSDVIRLSLQQVQNKGL